MASPPYQSAGSPPGPSSLALPRQRPTVPGLALPSKRRQPSVNSISAHPLRQTSFPPPEGQNSAATQYSDDDLGDVSDSEITSAISGPLDGQKRKRGEKRSRGRPPKNPSALRARSASLINGEEGRRRGTTAGAASVATGDPDEDDDEEEDDGGLGARGEAFTMDPAELDRDNQRRYLFREAVPPNHQNRYDAFNKVKLRTADVRKLVNQTLSQSVPQAVVTVVGSYTKMFTGMLIESAREVQAEWMAANPTRPDGGEQPAYKRLRLMQPTEEQSEDEEEVVVAAAKKKSKSPGSLKKEQTPPINGKVSEGIPESDQPPREVNDTKAAMDESSPANGNNSQQSNDMPNGTQQTEAVSTPEKHKKKRKVEEEEIPDDMAHVQPGAWGLSKYVEECDRGPLLPDHLREALRRYKKSRSGGTVGFTGISLYGMENRDVAASRMGGQRLFK